MTEKPPQPIARLQHVQPGQRVILVDDQIERVLLKTDRWYGYFDGMKASLCHPVNPASMVFGEGGWRVKESEK
ncbi:MAG: hypothetical protein CML17_06430 [Pusillimonas sp.]|nr:hypothetical protein [Pusillimonas sp.]